MSNDRLRQLLEETQKKNEKPQQADKESSLLRDVANTGAPAEMLLSMASKAIAEPVAGWAGIGASILPGGKTGPEAIEATREALTYEPRLEATQKAEAKLGDLLAPLEQGADRAGEFILDETGNPASAAAVKTAIMTLPMFFTRGAGRSQTAPVQAAQDLGYRLQPSQVIDGKPIGGLGRRAAEVGGGKAGIPARLSLHNQKITNDLVRREIGLNKDTTLSPAVLDMAKAKPLQVYKRIENLKTAVVPDGDYVTALQSILKEIKDEFADTPISKPVSREIGSLLNPKGAQTPRAVIKKIRQLRRDAKANFKAKDNPKKQQLAYAQKQAATALEDLLERRIKASGGDPNLVKEFRDARVQLAKINTVEDALVGTDVDARLLARERSRGGHLTGNLADIADVADHFPQVVETSARLGSKQGLGLLDAGMTVATLGAWPFARVGAQKLATMPPRKPPTLAGVLARGEFLSSQYEK